MSEQHEGGRRYVILEHHHQGVHYDLMFEAGAVLRTWKLPEPPAPDRLVSARRLFDHRLMYLDYEGSLSGDRGHVVRFDAGTFAGEIDAPPPVEVWLAGERLQGRLILALIRDDLWQIHLAEG